MNKLLLGAAGITGLAVLALGSSSKVQQVVSSAVEKVAEEGMDWINRVVGRTAEHEGGFDALNLNSDGAGLSFGILQWSQRTGALGNLLKKMAETDPIKFAATFGPGWEALLQTTFAGSLDPVEGALLWKEPWKSRFKAAGKDPIYQQIQSHEASNGEYFNAAVKAANILGIPTERAVSLAYDTAVQQGPGQATNVARKVVGLYAGKDVSTKAVLTTYAALAPAHFTREGQPVAPYPVKGIEWRQVNPSTWHAFAGSIDLFDNILKRRLSIVNDERLRDTAVNLSTKV